VRTDVEIWQIDIQYACGGIVVGNDGRVIKAIAPIFRKQIGWSIQEVAQWVEKQNGKLTKIENV
jgi:hypothetical protein